MPKAICILSGGLDSSVAMVMAMRDYEIECALTFDYGQRAKVCEIDAARIICKKLSVRHQVIEIPWLSEITNTSLVNKNMNVPDVLEESLDDHSRGVKDAELVWVPNRNGLFANIAGCFADAWDIKALIFGFNAEEAETFPDNSEEFSDCLSKCLCLSTKVKPSVVVPTLRLKKKEIAAYAVENNISSFWSCYQGGKKMCGKCESCMRTLRAFKLIGRLDFISGKFEEVK